MPASPDDSAYFRQRSEQHRKQAERCTDETQRLVHQRFVDIYARRAADEIVQDDQYISAKIPGTT